MMGVQIWRSMCVDWPWKDPVERAHAAFGRSSYRYYQRIDALTAQGVKFP